MNRDSQTPPVGGALLEAILAYHSLSLADGLSSAEALLHRGATPCEAENWNARTRENDFLRLPDSSTPSGFIEWAYSHNPVQINTFFTATLFDQEARICLTLDLDKAIVVLSTVEDFLWGFSGNPATSNFHRLNSFYDLCLSLCDSIKPIRAAIGSEGGCDDDLTQASNPSAYAFSHDAFFSIEAKKKLFDWYLSYGDRWDNAIKMPDDSIS